jgi:hypothetical protein
MPMDEYDSCHNHTYNRIINVYSNDDIDDIITNFLKSIKDVNNTYLRSDLKKLITNLRNSLEVLEDRHISSISGRISYYPESDINTEIGYVLKWFLITVWRRSSILTLLK